MSFRLHRNAKVGDPPYLLVLQHPLLDHVLESRIVAPVLLFGRSPVVPGLDPPLQVLGESHVVVLSSLVAVPKRYLGAEVPYEGIDEYDVKRCLDRLFFGF